MKRAARVEAMRARQQERARAMRAVLEQRRKAARAQLERRRRDAKGRRKRKRRWWLLAIPALLLLLLVDCEDESTSDPPPTSETEPTLSSAAAVGPVVPALPGGQVASISRPDMPIPSPEFVPWLDAFELQVAARSPRLAACFEGASRPGALQWSARVEAATGTVSDHELEPVLDTDALSAGRRACLVEVLSEPPYELAESEPRSVPPRVRLLLEF